MNMSHHTHRNSHHNAHQHSYHRPEDRDVILVEQELFSQATADAIYVIRSKGADSGVGCPIFYKGQSIACSFNSNFLPDELNGIVSLDDYSSMVAEVRLGISAMYCIFMTR
jgi:hypothetical protein